jgi:hypothetical protein
LAATLGSLPFFCVRRIGSTKIAVGNAIAAGFMIAAACGILIEHLEQGKSAVLPSVDDLPTSSVPSLTFLLASKISDSFSPTLLAKLFVIGHVFDVAAGVAAGVALLVFSEAILDWFGLVAPEEIEFESTDNSTACSSSSSSSSSVSSSLASSSSNSVDSASKPFSRRASLFLLSITLHALAGLMNTQLFFFVRLFVS